MDAVATSELGVERRGGQRPLADRDDPTGGGVVPRRHSGQHLDAGPGLLDPRRPDEDRVEGGVEPDDVEVGLEGVDLATERVAAHGDVQPADGLLVGGAVLEPVGEEDHAGAGAEHR